jgi:hypothetical protein
MNHLHNLWLKSPEERLGLWRKFRISETSSCDDRRTELQHIVNWWAFVPRVNLAMDPFDETNWPSIWEIISGGECCKYSLGLALALSVYFIDSDAEVTLARARDRDGSDEYFIAIIDGEYILNSPYASVAQVNDIKDKIDIRASWDIEDVYNT